MKKQHPAIAALCTRGNKRKINESPGITLMIYFKTSIPVKNNVARGKREKRTARKI